MAKTSKKILITTGDVDGIGLEITIKSLKELKPVRGTQYILLTSSKNKIPQKIGSFKTKFLHSLDEIIKFPDPSIILVIKQSTEPSQWISVASKWCLNDPSNSCLVNAPMSKNKSGEGHTEILKRVTKKNDLRMGFVGSKFNIVLGTTHIPISEITSKLNKKSIQITSKAGELLQSMTYENRDVLALGLSPHSGENGAISKFDDQMSKWLKDTSSCRLFKELLVPDAAFLNYKKKVTYLCWYHDQGLIPFKLIHGISNGIQVTLGLPFIRTSVDHGTAKDIFGKNIANHKSLLFAIESAKKYMNKRGHTLFD